MHAETHQALIDRQLASRRQLQGELRQTRTTHLREVTKLQRDYAVAVTISQKPEETMETVTVDEPLRQRRRRTGPAPLAP